jgi:hypothetical protein
VKLTPENEQDFRGLPAEEVIRQGLKDLAEGRESIGMFLVQIGSPRLRECGLELPPQVDGDADRKLYALLEREHGVEAAHSQYNSWIRQLVSFERGLERRKSSHE